MRKFYKFKVLATLIALFATVASYAVPALPTPVKVRQADGSELTVQKFGDEFFNWTTTMDGYNIAQQNGIYYYVNVNNDGTRVMTNQKANQIKSSSEIQFLSQFKNADMNFMASSIGSQTRVARLNEMQKLGNFPNTGKVKSIVLLIEYKDVKFGVTSPKDAFTNSLNKPGYSENGSTGSAYDYYTYNSGGKFDPEFVIAGPFTLKENMAYYGANDAAGNDIRPREMAIEAVEMASKEGVDFSQFDFDNDGVIDNVFFYYAGYNEAEGGPVESIWPHRWVVNKSVTVNGKRFEGYACSSEYRGTAGAVQAGIGTFCHEFGHVFGLADLYDTQNTGNPGLGYYNIMTSGSYNNNGCTPPLMNSLERMQIGWANPILINADKAIEMKPLSSSEVYRINTEIVGEFFLLENRQQTDCIWEKYIPSSGLGIVHIDQSAPYKSYWSSNRVNSTAHECAKFIYANNVRPGRGSSGWDKILYGNANKEWSTSSTPKNVGWSGKTNLVSLKDITIDPATKNVKFNAVVPSAAIVKGVVSSTLGAPLAGVAVKFIKRASAKQGQEGMARIASDPSTYEYTTNAMGGYNAELPEGEYIITAALADYSNYANIITVAKGEVTLNIVLKTNIEANFTKKTFSTGTARYAIEFGNTKIAPFTKYSAAEMKLLSNYDLRQIRTLVSSASKIKFMVLSAKDISKVVFAKEVSVNEGGYAVVDINAGEMLIEPGKDYYVGYQILEQPAGVILNVDNGTKVSENESIYLNGRWYTISQTVDGQTVTGNFLTELYLEKAAGYVEPTSVSIPATQQVALKGSVQLTATVMPEGANQAIAWSSSDVATVMVDKMGKITGLVKGTATIMATSQINGKIVGKCDVTVGEGIPASVSGAVKGVDNSAVAEATVQFIEKDPASAPAQVSSAVAVRVAKGTQVRTPSSAVALNSVLYKTQATGKTDAEGNYNIEGLLSGPAYDVLVSGSPKYDPFFGTLRSGLMEGENVLDIPGVKLNPLYGKNEHQYHNGTPRSGVGSATQALEFGIRIKKEDLTAGDRLMGLTFNANQMLADIAYIYIYFEEDLTTPVIDLKGVGLKAGINRLTFGDIGISIPDNQDVIVSIFMMGYMNLDTGEAVDGYSNIVWQDGEWVSASSLNPAFTGNWMISAYTETAEPVNITEIKIEEPTEQLTIGASIKLKSVFLPQFATYRTLAWTSSDENVATVDEKGVVTGLAVGPVTITATSVDADKKSASITFDVALKQAIVGQVKDVEGMVVSGGTLTFIPVTKSVAKVGELSVVSYQELLTKSDPIVATTDEKGMFDVNIPEGDYRVTVSGKGCNDLKQSITITKGLNKVDFSLVTRFSTTSKEYGYSDDTYTNAVGAGGGAFGAFAKWNKADLVSQKDTKITRFKFHINDACKITAMIVVGGDIDNPLYQKDITVSGPGWHVLKLTPDEFVDVPQDKDLYVGYYLKEYGEKIYPASTGSTATNEGKGNALFMNGSWTTLKVAGLDGNWMISYYGQSKEQIDGIDLSVGQIDANLSWSPAGYEQFQVSIVEKIDGATPEVVETQETKYIFQDLKAGATYTYEVAGFKDGKYAKMFGNEFTTMAKINDNPMVLVTKNDFTVGEMLLLKTINITSEDVVTWYINDVEQQYSEVNLDKKGVFVIKCKIERPGGKTIYTVKKITVK